MNRQLLVITAVAAIGLATAPATPAAGMHPDDRPFTRGTIEAPSLHPDDRAVARSTVVDVRPVAGGTHPDDRALARGPEVGPQPVLVRSSGRFDWFDAAIGAAGGLGLGLALFGAAMIQRQRRIVSTA